MPRWSTNIVKGKEFPQPIAVGDESTVSCAQQMKGRAHPSPFPSLSFSESKKKITAGLTQSSSTHFK